MALQGNYVDETRGINASQAYAIIQDQPNRITKNGEVKVFIYASEEQRNTNKTNILFSKKWRICPKQEIIDSLENPVTDENDFVEIFNASGFVAYESTTHSHTSVDGQNQQKSLYDIIKNDPMFSGWIDLN